MTKSKILLPVISGGLLATAPICMVSCNKSKKLEIDVVEKDITADTTTSATFQFKWRSWSEDGKHTLHIRDITGTIKAKGAKKPETIENIDANAIQTALNSHGTSTVTLSFKTPLVENTPNEVKFVFDYTVDKGSATDLTISGINVHYDVK